MKLGKYRHIKGKDYNVIGIALDVVSQGKVVLYQALYDCPDLKAEYGDNPIFTRPYEMFFEETEFEGKKAPRFVFIGDEPL